MKYNSSPPVAMRIPVPFLGSLPNQDPDRSRSPNRRVGCVWRAMEDEEAKAAQPQPTTPALKLRNYVPVEEDKAFDYVRVEAAKAASANLSELAQQKKVEGEEEEDLVAQGGTVSRVAVPEEDVVEGDVVRTANRRENWDLKRDVEKKLKRLERRTQQAMVELMREEEIARQKNQLQQ